MFSYLESKLYSSRTKAILLIREQLSLDKDGNCILERFEYQSWQRATGEVLKTYLGENSLFYIDFMKIKLLHRSVTDKPTKADLATEQFQMAMANILLVDCIEHIRDTNSIQKKPSLFGQLPIASQVALGTFGAILFFNIGSRFQPTSDKPTFENEMKQCEQTIVALQQKYDSLLLVLNSMSNQSMPVLTKDKNK